MPCGPSSPLATLLILPAALTLALAACQQTEPTKAHPLSGPFPGAVEDVATASGGCPFGCTGIPEEGTCDGSILLTCQGGLASCKDCALQGGHCVLDATVGTHACRPLGFENPSCLPDCAGRACGSDGCGGSCGFCPEGAICDGTTCRYAGGPCAEVGAQGACFGDVVATCSKGGLGFLDCQPLGRVCAFNQAAGINGCLFP